MRSISIRYNLPLYGIMTWKDKIQSNMLMIAMLAGILGFPFFRHLMPLLPPLIFFMLFFSFCRVRPRDLRFHTWHWGVLAVQIPLAIGVYYAFMALPSGWFHSTQDQAILAQGTMMCFIMPTATAAPIIAAKLGGDLESLTGFTLMTNFMTAIVVPAFFPLINPLGDLSFFPAMWMILKRIAPLLMGPFLLSWLVQSLLTEPQRTRYNSATREAPFYLWSCTIMILMGDLTHTLIYDDYNRWLVLIMAMLALITCLMQFVLGWFIGVHLGHHRHDMRVSAGQAFGQKNTSLAIWMANAYLLPLSAFAPAAYIIWQNIVNSSQLRHAGKK